ncbi:MAG: tRNA (N(6)-L-threonylcarbamoyladenosine(37)-C(2))-methylthiotransferase MtaB [Spirochaetota bacterium]
MTRYRVSVYTLGCKLNQCESEGVADAFHQQGFEVVSPSEPADMYIVNTCTVTSKAEQKARRMIRKFALSEGKPLVIVTGCYAQLEPEVLQQTAERIVVLPLDKKAALLTLPAHVARMLEAGTSLREAVEAFMSADMTRSEALSPFAYEADTFMYHSRAFLKIEDGCDNTCSYCRVRLARGPAVSLAAEEVLQRCRQLEARGYREIVLTGVNITAYHSGGGSLPELLELLLSELGDGTRLRLSSLEPDMITEELIAQCVDPRIQPHFHIPLQSASDRMLARVNRAYAIGEAGNMISRLRKAKDDPFLAADIITGLPGEQESDVLETYEFVSSLGFSHLHVFPYSPRPGTALYKSGNYVPESLRDKRAAAFRELSSQLYADYITRWSGKPVEVVIEGSKAGNVRGLSGNYLKGVVTGIPAAYRPYEQLRGRMCQAVCETSDEAPGVVEFRFTSFM